MHKDEGRTAGKTKIKRNGRLEKREEGWRTEKKWRVGQTTTIQEAGKNERKKMKGRKNSFRGTW